MTGLLELAERVEAATGPDRVLDTAIFAEIDYPAYRRGESAPTYTSSIDSAMSLVPPGDIDGEGPWLPCFESGQVSQTEIEWVVTLAHNVLDAHAGEARTAPLALVAAALRSRATPSESSPT